MLLERGIPALEHLLTALHKPIPELMGLASKGTFGRDAIRALIDEAGAAPTTWLAGPRPMRWGAPSSRRCSARPGRWRRRSAAGSSSIPATPPGTRGTWFQAEEIDLDVGMVMR